MAAGAVLAALAVLVLVLLLGGGAPQAAPAGLPDASPAVRWALAAAPLLTRLVGAATVGFALLAGGSLGVRRLAATGARVTSVCAFAWAALVVVFGVLTALETQALNPGTPVLDQMAGSLGVQAMFAQFLLAVLVGVVAILLPRLALPFALVALVPEMLTGHVRTAESPLVVGVALVAHVAAAALWVGGLLVLGWLALRHRSAWVEALPRYSGIAFDSVLVLAVTGTVTAVSRIDSLAELVGSAYGVVVALKALALVTLGALGWLQRRHVVGRADRRTRDFVLLAGTELTLMMLTFALATALAQTPPPA